MSVYQAMHEAGIELDWFVGTSIGAINGAIIAGNHPARRMERLHGFWDRMALNKNNPFGAFLSIFDKTATNMSTVIKAVPGLFCAQPGCVVWTTRQARPRTC